MARRICLSDLETFYVQGSILFLTARDRKTILACCRIICPIILISARLYYKLARYCPYQLTQCLLYDTLVMGMKKIL
jgi:hypothetical protein